MGWNMLKFTKMHGLGNDYVYIDCTKAHEKYDFNELAKYVSNRHFGIGSDGLIAIFNSNVADFKMRIFNYDGTEAEMCGNGIRCVGKYIYDKGLSKKEELSIETLSGIKKVKLSINGGKIDSVKVNMGSPIIDFEDNVVSLEVLDKVFDASLISMGNPHAVILVDNVDNFDVEKYGKLIETHNKFPNRTNVEFVEIINNNLIKMRVWERGAGETLACGTGACASVVACSKRGMISRKCNVRLLGGNLKIFWDEIDNNVYMEGTATCVFDGNLDMSIFEGVFYDESK